MAKTLEFMVNRPFEEVWEGSLNFWKQERGKIIDPASSENDESRIVDIHKGASLMSWGEKYVMEFFRIPDDPNRTQVIITIKLNMGYGPSWYLVSRLLKKWALYVGVEPQEFGLGVFIATYAILIGLIIFLVSFTIIMNSFMFYPYYGY